MLLGIAGCMALLLFVYLGLLFCSPGLLPTVSVVLKNGKV